MHRGDVVLISLGSLHFFCGWTFLIGGIDAKRLLCNEKIDFIG